MGVWANKIFYPNWYSTYTIIYLIVIYNVQIQEWIPYFPEFRMIIKTGSKLLLIGE